MKVSVIIPTYNEEKDIVKCLESLNNQTLKDFEVIVVDDGSKDRTYNVVYRAKKKIKIPLKIYQQNHQGPAMARNLGAKHARGEILVFVDADMSFDKDFLKKLIPPIENGSVIGTFSKDEYVSNWENAWARCWNYMEGWEDKKRHPKDFPATQKVFRAIVKKDFDAVGGFSPGGYTDDYTLFEKLGKEAIAAKGAIFYHRNPDSLGEIFTHARWVGKRKYKLGVFGFIAALVRSFILSSIVKSMYQTMKHRTLACIPFQIVYDAGIFLGILQYMFSGRGAK